MLSFIVFISSVRACSSPKRSLAIATSRNTTLKRLQLKSRQIIDIGTFAMGKKSKLSKQSKFGTFAMGHKIDQQTDSNHLCRRLTECMVMVTVALPYMVTVTMLGN